MSRHPRLFGLIPVLVAVLCLTGCGQSNDVTPNTSAPSSEASGNLTPHSSDEAYFSICTQLLQSAIQTVSVAGSGCSVSMAAKLVNDCRITTARAAGVDLDTDPRGPTLSQLYHNLVDTTYVTNATAIRSIESSFPLDADVTNAVELNALRCNRLFRTDGLAPFHATGAELANLDAVCGGSGTPPTSQAEVDAVCARHTFGTELQIRLPGLPPIVGNDGLEYIRSLASDPDRFDMSRYATANVGSSLIGWMYHHCVKTTCQSNTVV